jgi:type I restriction-modification system DNA methylase subunit
MPVAPETIHRLLSQLPQRRSLEAVLELFDALGYQYADELPLPTRDWPDGVRNLTDESVSTIIYLAQHRDFRVIYTHFTSDRLSRGVERSIVEQTLRKLHPYVFFVFANRDLTHWDFVNVKYSAGDEDGDGTRRRTIRRIHVGPGERLHTAAQRVALLTVPAADTSALELQSLHDQAFDVEEVTKQFYRDYVNVFGALCDDIAARNPKRKDDAEREAQILLDRLMFLYFIQKKGWLDDRTDYLPRRLQEYYAADPDGIGFYTDFLFPLFVALSNEGVALPSLGDVPFLNGGLFEVAADAPVTGQLAIGNRAFRQVFDDLLECYNFTVREDTPLDVEMAIDPEMLGQIFENLVLGLERGEDRRKSTGSYYTPRVIVHFMCRRALKEYLAAESGLAPERVEALMEVGPAEQLTPEEAAELRDMITEPEARLLRELVMGMRGLDPAVGSGAFLVGMLYEMVALTKLLDVRLHGQAHVQRRNYDYDLKRHFIERNLYGVDIQPEAARICELRLWLSLMVDYEREAGEPVPPLPNLSYRVRVGDSLIERLFGEPVQLDALADDAQVRVLIDRIQAEKQAYFMEPNLWEKRRRELHILELMCELAVKLVGAGVEKVMQRMLAAVPSMGEAFMSREHRKLKAEFEAELERYQSVMEQAKAAYGKVQAMQAGELPAGTRDVNALRVELGLSFIWRLDFTEVFADKGGFDVVIANPPYGVDVSTLQDDYSSSDSYSVFFEQSLRLTRHRAGLVCFIMPTSWETGEGFVAFRKWLFRSTRVKSLVNLPYDVFEVAYVDTCILLTVNTHPEEGILQLATIPKATKLSACADITQFLQDCDDSIITSDSHLRVPLDIALARILHGICELHPAPLGNLCGSKRGVEAYQYSILDTKAGVVTKPYFTGNVYRYSTVGGADKFIDVGPQTTQIWQGRRILLRRIVSRSNRLQADWVDEPFIVKKDLYVIMLRPNIDFDLRSLLAILNSSLLSYLYLARSASATKDDFRQITLTGVRQLPIVHPPEDKQSRLISLVDRIRDSAANESSDLFTRLDKEIDDIIFETYGVSKADRRVIQNWLAQPG